MKETKDIERDGNVVRFLHQSRSEENKASVVIDSKKDKNATNRTQKATRNR